MNQLPTHIFMYTTFGVAAAIELYFFMMQRSALEISRAAGIDRRDGRKMLPLWYMTVWPVQIAKWGSLIAIALEIHWGTALVLLALTFILTTIVPIPHQHFIPLFRRKVMKELVLEGFSPVCLVLSNALNHSSNTAE